MSMNLYFETKQKSKWHQPYIDFPFQTPTSLTNKVMKLKTTGERLQAIREQLEEWKWDKDDISEKLEQIREMLEDPDLVLTFA